MGTKVRDVMTPDPIYVRDNQTLAETARAMREADVGAVLVVAEQSLRGLVTDRDLVVRALAESKGPDDPVGPICSGDVVGVEAEADTTEAVRLMRDNAVRRLPVVDGGRIAGMVSLGDLAVTHDPASALADVSKAHPNT